MHIDIRKHEDVVVVDLSGKLTAGLGDQILHDTIDELLGENWRKILLNLSEITFIDSAGIGELVSGLKTAQHVGAHLKILNTNERVNSTLFITRLLPLFDVFREEHEALKAFAAA